VNARAGLKGAATIQQESPHAIQGFDPSKSASNGQQHGIDCIDAQALGDDWTLLEIPAKTVEDEGCCLAVGKIGSKHWSAVIPYRGDALRIISVRRSRDSEVEYYESSGS
jgi:uncharacterized DUF497 family protein